MLHVVSLIGLLMRILLLAQGHSVRRSVGQNTMLWISSQKATTDLFKGSGGLRVSDPKYNQILHRSFETTFTPGEELHLLTQDAYGQRVLNLRIFRVAPSRSGHTGYTQRGFYLNRNEALLLRDHLNDILEDDSSFEPTPSGLTPVEETLTGGDE